MNQRIKTLLEEARLLYLEADDEEVKKDVPPTDELTDNEAPPADDDQIASFKDTTSFINALTADSEEDMMKNVTPMSVEDYDKQMNTPELGSLETPMGNEEKEPVSFATGNPKFYVLNMKGKTAIGEFESKKNSPKEAFEEAFERFGLGSELGFNPADFTTSKELLPYIARYSKGLRQVIVINIDISSIKKMDV